jgi:TRAP-type C4-dicarboxylate transport system permease small subunit
MPSVTPIAVLYAAIPVAGGLVALFTIEELVNGWRHGFQAPGRATAEPIRPPVS